MSCLDTGQFSDHHSASDSVQNNLKSDIDEDDEEEE
jgi:hypothetical protein